MDILAFKEAFISSFPTQEEKEEILKAEKEQEEINKAWGAFFAGGMVSDGEGEILSRVEVVEGGEVVECSCSGRKEGEGRGEGEVFSCGRLSQDDFERGFVLTRIGTNEVFDFSVPTNAVVCADWLQFGATEDWVYLELGDSRQGLGGERLRVHSDGWLAALQPTSAVFVAKEYYPFKTTLGIAPEVNWKRIVFSRVEHAERVEVGECGSERVMECGSVGEDSYAHSPFHTPRSLFWHCLTPSNTLQLTWQNVLYNRESDLPISFQAEFFENGDFVYRYDLASIRARLASGCFSENWASNVVIRADSQNSASLRLF